MLFVLTIIVLMIPALVFADNVTVLFNGEKLEFPDAKPFINTDSRTMIPLRFVSETLGAEVDWNAHTKTVTITQEETVIELTIGANYASKNGQSISLDTRAIIYYDRTMIPLRFVSEVLGATVDWNANTKTVVITKEIPVEEKPVVEKPSVEEKPKIDVPTTDFQPTKPGEVPEELTKEHYYYYMDRAIETIQFEDGIISIYFPELPPGYHYSHDYGYIDNLGNRKQELVFFRNQYVPSDGGVVTVEKDGILKIDTKEMQIMSLNLMVYNQDDIAMGGTSIRFPDFAVSRGAEVVGYVSDYQK